MEELFKIPTGKRAPPGQGDPFIRMARLIVEETLKSDHTLTISQLEQLRFSILKPLLKGYVDKYEKLVKLRDDADKFDRDVWSIIKDVAMFAFDIAKTAASGGTTTLTDMAIDRGKGIAMEQVQRKIFGKEKRMGNFSASQEATGWMTKIFGNTAGARLGGRLVGLIMDGVNKLKNNGETVAQTRFRERSEQIRRETGETQDYVNREINKAIDEKRAMAPMLMSKVAGAFFHKHETDMLYQIGPKRETVLDGIRDWSKDAAFRSRWNAAVKTLKLDREWADTVEASVGDFSYAR